MQGIDEDKTFICHECISDAFLKKDIKDEGKREKCSYCGKSRKAIQLQELANRIHSVIEEHFYLTSSEPSPLEYAMAKDNESSYDWERSGEPIDYILQVNLGIDETIATDIQEYLSGYFSGDPKELLENPYGDEACYEENPPDRYDFQESWEFFLKEITTRARYFNEYAEKVLYELFCNLDSLRTFDGKSVVRIAGPKTELSNVSRARVCQTLTSLDKILKAPIKELSAPPAMAAKHGRMNAAGISVFYGATDAQTCIAEVRPPVGSHVVVGRFEIIRNLRLLDLNILSEIYATGSYFDTEFKRRKGHAAFLQSLVDELTKPVMPDKETLGYLPTQIVAEYLAEKVKPHLDGIIFNSSQTKEKGQNIILFQNCCAVEPYNLPIGTIVSINYGWGLAEDYDDSIAVDEELPLNTSQSEQSEHIVNCPNIRDITLRLDVKKDIDVLVIEGATYHSHKRGISRYRHEKYISESNPLNNGKSDSFW